MPRGLLAKKISDDEPIAGAVQRNRQPADRKRQAIAGEFRQLGARIDMNARPTAHDVHESADQEAESDRSEKPGAAPAQYDREPAKPKTQGTARYGDGCILK